MKSKTHKFYHVKLVREGRASYSTAIKGADDAVAFFQKQIGANVQENFAAVYINTRNIPLGWREISRGAGNAVMVQPLDVFLPAIQLAASALIVAHNHPSDVAEPSQEDIYFTRRLKEAGKMLGIQLLDHLIVTKEGFTSLKEKGVM
ncbi:MAG: DNA repair protein RadC [Candidatus Andersenbacteria bacterium CG10_big_fil_rev_8_21_14_0_10_54_11]|uniref:DNA repair protein RadC n=1 Tax=Candidatus Andersenbacteria bacterium CG10_big_fil_rev_8_21_14_0_10_54_11 TaxID=1974485 RepID=A0A2M6X010_9BACT|nr:MAG: DNA repair protein RadC [Candidatus Andersenbacteria bacterium CG10_big_fil_rev_8_21_14_0_10_54_11]